MTKEELKTRLFNDFVSCLKTDKMYNYRWFMHYRRHHYKGLSALEMKEVYGQAVKFFGA